jgi:CRP/FNR family transcriptional regulator
MLAFSQSEYLRGSGFTRAEKAKGDNAVQAAAERRLSGGEILFQAGDARARLYRVERGALCHYRRWDDGRCEIIEFAFPGDIIGFGHLDAYISTAQAMVETLVSTLAPEKFEQAVRRDDHLAARLSAAADREFDYLRDCAVAAGKGKPVERLASFLAAMSHMSVDEGRDPMLVCDDLSSGLVAEHLDMTIDILVGALRELEQRGIVRNTDKGLRIFDMSALEQLARVA